MYIVAYNHLVIVSLHIIFQIPDIFNADITCKTADVSAAFQTVL